MKEIVKMSIALSAMIIGITIPILLIAANSWLYQHNLWVYAILLSVINFFICPLILTSTIFICARLISEI